MLCVQDESQEFVQALCSMPHLQQLTLSVLCPRYGHGMCDLQTMTTLTRLHLYLSDKGFSGGFEGCSLVGRDISVIQVALGVAVADADSTSSCGVLLKSVSVGCVSQSVAVCFARESACGCTLETSYNDREAVTINLTCQGVSLCLHVCARTQLFVELHPQYTYICPPSHSVTLCLAVPTCLLVAEAILPPQLQDLALQLGQLPQSFNPVNDLRLT